MRTTSTSTSTIDVWHAQAILALLKIAWMEGRECMSLRVYVRPKVHLEVLLLGPTYTLRLISFFIKYSAASIQEMCVSRLE